MVDPDNGQTGKEVQPHGVNAQGTRRGNMNQVVLVLKEYLPDTGVGNDRPGDIFVVAYREPGSEAKNAAIAYLLNRVLFRIAVDMDRAARLYRIIQQMAVGGGDAVYLVKGFGKQGNTGPLLL